MSVHMIRVYAGPVEQAVKDAVDSCVQDHTLWDPDRSSEFSAASDAVMADPDPQYYSGAYWFETTVSGQELLDHLQSNLDQSVSDVWYRIGYHECTHDQDATEACSWEQVIENGSIPDTAPNIA